MIETIELILLILTYTILVITIFISVICYRKNLEKTETIAFMISLLLLSLSITAPVFFQHATTSKTAGIFNLISLTLVGLTAPLNVLAERKHNIPRYVRTILYGVAGILILLIITGYFLDFLDDLDHTVAIFLAATVVFSMTLTLLTKPQAHISHIEKSDRMLSVLFLIIVPTSLYANFFLEESGYLLKVDLALLLTFMLLSASKLYDDLKRLSLVQTNIKPLEQHFMNYHISPREKEIVVLLIEGKTYKSISEELHISIPTIKTHASNIYKKCGVKNRHEMTRIFVTR
ncbi:MAG: LuxR C-terminal-related transcriptional regulator [Bacteroidota bacterium]